jgi:hypothetical protein
VHERGKEAERADDEVVAASEVSRLEERVRELEGLLGHDALVDAEGLPMRVVVRSAVTQDRDGPGWSSTRYAGASSGSNRSGPFTATTLSGLTQR